MKTSETPGNLGTWHVQFLGKLTNLHVMGTVETYGNLRNLLGKIFYVHQEEQVCRVCLRGAVPPVNFCLVRAMAIDDESWLTWLPSPFQRVERLA